MFYNSSSVSKYAIYIIRNYFVNTGAFGSIFRSVFIVYNTYTGPRRMKRANVSPIQVPVLNNDINVYYKIDSFNVIPKIFLIILVMISS